MIDIQPITLATAAQLLDFAGRSAVAQAGAAGQLEGAVALHNLLARPDGRVAYLADEVGMGKTYVVLGTLALLRHYHPALRVLYIVPKANLQRKWGKELRNFTANNWRIVDHRVKSFQGTPVAEPVVCENLLDLVREAALDAHRDFILRLSSFSLPLSHREAGGKAWKEKAEELRQAFPGIAEQALEVDGRIADAHDQRKDAFACAVNEVLPHFDLLVLDEGHNLKHGFQNRDGAARNRLLAYVLGTQKGPNGRRLERRIDRAILLSATPVDNGYVDLWHQLNLLGLADERFEPLREDDGDGQDAGRQKQAAAQCLIRRLTHITIGGQPHTRNMYRREWRGGGVETHDQPLKVPDDVQRLVVALMQKKVADVLAEQGHLRQKRFSRSFQIGMLASFESFSRTPKLAGEDANFDQTEQSEDSGERQGIDTLTINDVAKSYRETFNGSLPHPKMDSVVKDLWSGIKKGRKTLVFVRRIHSVPEMVEKLTEKYNDWLKEYVVQELRELPDPERQRFERKFNEYDQQRKDFYSRGAAVAFAGGQPRAGDDADSASIKQTAEPAGFESFFSWFFRGEGPAGILSGARLSRNRLDKAKSSAQLSTLFDDNWLLWLLGYPAEPLSALAAVLDRPADELARDLRCRAAAIHHAKKPQKRKVFLAYQQAAMELICRQTRDLMLAEQACVLLDRHDWTDPTPTDADERSFPDPQRYLGLKTFFTELAEHPALCMALWPDGNSPLGSLNADFARAFVEREQRRLLLDSAIRLGHPMIDLWLLYARLTGTLAPGGGDEAETQEPELSDDGGPLDERLARRFVELLDGQRRQADSSCRLTSFAELHRLAVDFALLADVNFHGMRDRPLSALTRYFADQLGQQQPIAGMYGGVSPRTIRQFRMPGYPYVLVTTDVLQEGEDLHTYCDRIVHYGITWTPSALEQRTGRVDRIGSLVQRRLENELRTPAQIDDDDYLQVYFPYLRDTYEYMQVGVVFERLNRFLEMLHDLRLPSTGQTSEVDVARRIHERAGGVFQPYREPLKSGFEVPEDLKGAGPAEPVVRPENDRQLEHFGTLAERLQARFRIEWNISGGAKHHRRGIAYVQDGRLLQPNAGKADTEIRRQPFTLTLRTTHGGRLLLRCASRLGTISEPQQVTEVLRLQRANPRLKICADLGDDEGSYRLSVRSDLLFSCETTQHRELEHAFATLLVGADQLEAELFAGKDHTNAELSDDSAEDAGHGTN